MDNRVFNVNGRGVELLALTLQVAVQQRSQLPRGFRKDEQRGLVLYWYIDEDDQENSPTPFLGQPSILELASLILQALDEDWAKKIPCEDWDADTDHDGHNVLGWRAYCDDWGHIGDDSSAFLAIKPAYLWIGK